MYIGVSRGALEACGIVRCFASLSVPMSEALPGVLLPSSLKSVPPAPKLESSAIHGVNVASLTGISPIMSLGLVLKGGSSAETDATAGGALVFQSMALKAATKERTQFRLTRELEKIGAITTAKASRDALIISITAAKIHLPEATELLLDSVLNTKLHYHEVRDNLEILKEQLAKAISTPSVMLEEVLHRVAYDGPLGQPLIVDPSHLDAFTHENLQQYLASVLKPGNLLLVGLGASYGELKSLSEPLLDAAHLSSSASPAAAASKYLGGTSHILSPTSPLTHLAVAYEAKGGLSDMKTQALTAVVKALLSENKSVLPHSRSESELFRSWSSFSHLYADSGLFGVMASSEPKKVAGVMEAFQKKMSALSSGVSDAQLKQAKQVALGASKAALSSASTALPVIASQILLSGKFNAMDFPSAVESLTSAQISAFISSASKSSPTIVTYGSSIARL